MPYRLAPLMVAVVGVEGCCPEATCLDEQHRVDQDVVDQRIHRSPISVRQVESAQLHSAQEGIRMAVAVACALAEPRKGRIGSENA
jgi:hypothetical protein